MEICIRFREGQNLHLLIASLDRIRKHSFKKDDKQLSFVHILDLHEDGVIKPHIDSVRYCGDVITGLSLLSDAVMRLRHKDKKDELIVDLFLQRRCLYRMGEFSRYEFYHEVLGKSQSYFMGKLIPRSRRISVICRDLPPNVQKNESLATSSVTGKREVLQRSDTE
uniref:Alpha-ketoglutarate-dependent dioxygenase AlkB-like domain-containing protein n=1 Tax=Setaria digitata TaxID=48799 RepID=A0A915Q883_9BILA